MDPQEELYKQLEDFDKQLQKNFNSNCLTQFISRRDLPQIKVQLKNFLNTKKCINEEQLKLKDTGKTLLNKINALPMQQLQRKEMQYFKKIYPSASLQFIEKTQGIQFGNKILIEPPGCVYYVKTHRYGRSNAQLSSSASVDPKELLVYKILEKLSFGPETHFLYYDKNNLYIASKDWSSQNTYELYSMIRMSNYYQDNSLLNKENFVNGIILADILQRVLYIEDLLNNSTNFGFSKHDQKLMILDFSPPKDDEFYQPHIYRDWLTGNSQFNYNDLLICEILKTNMENKIKCSYPVLVELNKYFISSIDQSLNEVLNILKDVYTEEIKVICNLKEYAGSVKSNFYYLLGQIQREYAQLNLELRN